MCKVEITDNFYICTRRKYEIRYNREKQVLSIHRDYHPKPTFTKKLNRPMTESDFKHYLAGINFTIFGHIMQSTNYTEEQ
jgi:hypothetical protein